MTLSWVNDKSLLSFEYLTLISLNRWLIFFQSASFLTRHTDPCVNYVTYFKGFTTHFTPEE
jgi:hypothetical protein